ncbi:hypothetical protein LINPERHAP1_LOCUS30958, partial [Linum perenne]
MSTSPHPHYSMTGSTHFSSHVTHKHFWILDSGSDHIICDMHHFISHKPLDNVGIVKLSSGLLLTQVLFVPSFTYNLISI